MRREGEVGVEPPHPRPDPFERRALCRGEADQGMDQTLGVDPTARVMADVELTGAVADDHRIREQAVVGDAAPHGAFGGNLHRLRVRPGRADPEASEMGAPGHLAAKAPGLVVRQLGDVGSRQIVPAHIGHGGVVDHVVAVPGAQQLQEVQPALRSSRGEPGEVIVADLGTHAVRSLVAGAGVVDRDPPRGLQPGAAHIRRLGQEARPGVGQKPHNLPLGDHDPEVVELGHQTRHRHLAAVILRQHEAPQLGTEVADDPGRQRRHRRPLGRQPALTPKPDHMTAHHQILDHIILVALEPRARRHGRRDDAILVDDQAFRALAPALGLAPPSPLRPARSLHPARLDRRAPVQTLKARNLIA